jgi:hypothetical protein
LQPVVPRGTGIALFQSSQENDYQKRGGIMVSQMTSDTISHETGMRGTVTQERIVSAAATDIPVPAPSFWGSIVAGTTVVLGIGALSDFLMFGCHVGVYRNGRRTWALALRSG